MDIRSDEGRARFARWVREEHVPDSQAACSEGLGDWEFLCVGKNILLGKEAFESLYRHLSGAQKKSPQPR